MLLITTDGRVLDVHAASNPCGYRVYTMTLEAKDFDVLRSASDEQKLKWIETWMVRFSHIESGDNNEKDNH